MGFTAGQAYWKSYCEFLLSDFVYRLSFNIVEGLGCFLPYSSGVSALDLL